MTIFSHKFISKSLFEILSQFSGLSIFKVFIRLITFIGHLPFARHHIRYNVHHSEQIWMKFQYPQSFVMLEKLGNFFQTGQPLANEKDINITMKI